ncbi:MAG: glutamate formimidoyltransferase [Saprospiraceae bacterium]|nr:glutamate formimidoyltransferase [Saprospiraceae bacterium]MCF8249446.1 glutamate formimidoyltransferase [Saprospiraceae bacterium]MCF8279100.1 glutamate formimidoyltransferase [Bacteroidales bacterium]MCF8311575.1 glutamate formimidoyltransferase [Saprospiraceae bacterium]MCF8440065.1 glutamate formimidoyltransferase [Saprospiraceae bacterium]
MTNQLIECVPNFSEGRDMAIIKLITDEIESVEGVKLLDVDPGKATNRTVVTFVGAPEPVIQAAYLAIKKAAEVIDMSKHKGEHPRMGATDVCPLIPIANITMEETAKWAHKLGEKAGSDLGIPFYMYESAATKPERRNLATVRSGEYEALPEKLKKPEWKPDYGPAVFNAKAGATAIGARDFLVAYNVNLNTTSERRANSVAFDVREQGRVMRKGDPIEGEIVRDASGEPVREAGACKAVKGIGWYIPEYGVAQVSMNLTNIEVTPLHVAFEECRKSANNRGMRVTGSELVGLVPLKVLTEAGRYFLQQQKWSAGVSEEELVHIAVKSLGLDELTPFDPKKKIIEYQLADEQSAPLIHKSLRAFANETAKDSPAPGGGSISAYVGALGASLGTMVANLSAGKRGWDDRLEEFSAWAEKGQAIKDSLLKLVDEDTNAFNQIMAAFRLPKETAEEKAARKAAIQAATRYAIEAPMRTMEAAFAVFELAEAMVKDGNPNSVSDAGVGALCARAAVMGAWMNVKINAVSLADKELAADFIQKAEAIVRQANEWEQKIVKMVEEKM